MVYAGCFETEYVARVCVCMSRGARNSECVYNESNNFNDYLKTKLIRTFSRCSVWFWFVFIPFGVIFGIFVCCLFCLPLVFRFCHFSITIFCRYFLSLICDSRCRHRFFQVFSREQFSRWMFNRFRLPFDIKLFKINKQNGSVFLLCIRDTWARRNENKTNQPIINEMRAQNQ